MIKTGKKVVLALSGGIFSAVAGLLLKEMGYTVVGYHLAPARADIYGNPVFNCYKPGTQEMVKKIAALTGINYFIKEIDAWARDEDKNSGSDGSVSAHRNCFKCDSSILWEEMEDFCGQYGADYIATGHYASIYKNISPGRDISIPILPEDISFSQTHLLWNAQTQILDKLILPLGSFKINEIIGLAKIKGIGEVGLEAAVDSCFEVEQSEQTSHLSEAKQNYGPLIFNGLKIGSYKGLDDIMIGRDASPAGYFWEPLIIKRIDQESKFVEAGLESDFQGAAALAGSVNIFSGKNFELPEKMNVRLIGGEQLKAYCSMRRDGLMQIDFNEPIKYFGPGNPVAFFKNNLLYGGGIVKKWL